MPSFKNKFAKYKVMLNKVNSILRIIAKKLMFATQLFSNEFNWYKRCLNYNNSDHSKGADLSSLLVISHVLEKGITMPNRRLGFGYERVRLVIERCNFCISQYGSEPMEIQSALVDLRDYFAIHEEASFKLPEDIVNGINGLVNHIISDKASSWMEFTPDTFFKKCNSFEEFTGSRHTCRYYSKEPVEIDKIVDCIRIAQTAPSACNRQSTRVHIISSREAKQVVLKYQNGTRGFGQDADKFLLITAEQSAWDFRQSKSAFIDAGLYTMALLYALHEKKICACTLNAHIFGNSLDSFYREIGIPKSEILIAFIAIGNAVDKFLVAKSERIQTESLYSII